MYSAANIILAIIMTALGVTKSSVTPVGKCNTYNITTVPIDFERLAKLGKWEVIYVPDSDLFLLLDHELRDVVITGRNTVKLNNRKVKKNKSNELYEFSLTYVDGVLVEDIVEENGTPHRFRNYPLAITSEAAMLYYRCSDTGSLDIDTRYIVIPRKNKLSDAGLQKLMDADGKYSWFRGKLRKLEKRLVKAV